MGGNIYSSKRKSSKKKRPKNYSQVSRKKKIKRNESKKRHRRHDSVSSYSDDDSINSPSISTSTSESDYRRRKNKSKTRGRDYSISSYSDDYSMSSASDSLSGLHNDHRSRKAKSQLEHRRKRARKRSTSPLINEDSTRLRKRKRSKREHDINPRKKNLKKSKKHARARSSSSDSQSCSTCQSRRIGRAGDREIERTKGILDKKIESARGGDLHEAHRKRKARRPSCSPSRYSDHSVSVSHSEEVVAAANNSRRLRSVIAVAEQPRDDEENRWETDPNKEEVVYNKDDCPSPRSIDSDDGRRRGESDYRSQDASDKKSRVEVTEKGVKHLVSGDQNDTGDSQSNQVHTNISEKEKMTENSASVTDFGGDDLESILRQKALENLRKFRGGLQTNRKITANSEIDNESDVNKISSARADMTRYKSTEQVSSTVPHLTLEMGNSSSIPTLKRDLSDCTEIIKDIPGSEDAETEPKTGKQSAIRPRDEAALSIRSQNENCYTAQAISDNPASTTDPNQGAVATIAGSSATVESTSCNKPTSGEHTLKDQQNDAKDGSQYEQKTMSVMRGGEMVQVSYKVYIPKRTPALSRRQLRR